MSGREANIRRVAAGIAVAPAPAKTARRVMVTAAVAIPLPDRGVVRIAGDDRVSFLQGLVSNDVRRVSGERALYAALLTPQGKFLHDFFIVEHDHALELDCEAARAEDLRARLSRYRLRTKVEITNVTAERAIAAVIDPAGLAALGLDAAAAGAARAVAGGVAYVDPRLAAAGARLHLAAADAAAALAAAGFVTADGADYERHRLALGLPDGSRDMAVEKAILLECGFDELGGVDWDKGCYVGQELTARTKYRGLIKRRLVPVIVAGTPLPPAGTPIFSEAREVGELRSGFGDRALALLRLDALAAAKPLSAAGLTLTPALPAWMRQPG
jgi:folate-binding protein YgfZ